MKMQRRFLAPAAAVALFTLCVQAIADNANESSKKEQLQDTARKWAEAIENKDKAAMRSILAEDFLHIDAAGKTRDKAETIKHLSADNLALKASERDHEITRIYDDTAIMTARMILIATVDSERRTLELKDINCWVLRDGRWRLTVYQATPVR